VCVRGRFPHVAIITGASGRRRGVLTWEDHPQTTLSGLDPWCYSWQCLDGRGWPLTAGEERVFVNALKRAAGPVRDLAQPSREDITALLSMMRCGVGVDGLGEVLPGVVAGQLLAAHRELDAKLRTARRAWDAILSDPREEVVLQNGERASLLCPVPLQLLSGSEQVLAEPGEVDDHEMQEWVAKTASEMGSVRNEASGIEEALGHFTRPSAEAVELGRLLYDPRSPSLWSDPYFLPHRVGELAPVRVAALLGERRRRRK
jgi:hypothetical protein